MSLILVILKNDGHVDSLHQLLEMRRKQSENPNEQAKPNRLNLSLLLSYFA